MKTAMISEDEIDYLRRHLAQIDADLLSLLRRAKETPEPKPAFIDPLSFEGSEMNSD